MARLGIDFGTTNTVAVLHDRGMFSVVLHQLGTATGTIVQEVYPSTILYERQSGQTLYGPEAERRFAQLGSSSDAVFIPSLKRQLHAYAEGRTVQGNGEQANGLDVAGLLTGFLRSFADSIRRSQGLDADEPLETVITWPANANGAQRHITRHAFREAGFIVLDTLNEPTASAIELADCLTAGRGGKAAGPQAIAVFDLGGGTFDASVVWVEGDAFEVLASAGIETLGGDDFDELLLGMFLDRLQTPSGQVGALTRHALLRQVRTQKEMISTGTLRSLFLNPMDFGLDGRPTSIPVGEYEERIRPLLMPAMAMLKDVIDRAAVRKPELRKLTSVTLYLVGGSSRLPLVARMASEAFRDSRVVLTDKPFQSVAMGAAISAMDRVSYRDVFARHFGLIRLSDHGRREVFDRIFEAGTPIPRRGEAPLERVAWYHPAHNLGHLRYLECTQLDQHGMPAGGVRTWSDVLFPYDPGRPLSGTMAEREPIVETDRFAGEPVCEVYRCDSDGVITVELQRPSRGESRTLEIYRE